MESVLIVVLFFGIPVAVFVWFVVALIMFLTTPKDNTEKRKTRKVLAIVSGAIFGVMLLAIIWLIVSFAIAIRHM